MVRIKITERWDARQEEGQEDKGRKDEDAFPVKRETFPFVDYHMFGTSVCMCWFVCLRWINYIIKYRGNKAGEGDFRYLDVRVKIN